MKNCGRVGFAFLLLSCCWLSAQSPKVTARDASSLRLKEGWALQSSCKVEEKGEVVSSSKFVPKGWYTVSVPTTVVAALVKQKV